MSPKYCCWFHRHWQSASEARLTVFKPIVRCIATHVNLDTGARDIDMVAMLREHFERDTLGTYFSVAQGGRVAVGNEVGA